MTPLRAALIAAGTGTVVLLVAVWQVPQWLDWTRYRATIELIASATLGQSVTIHGPISLSVLPQPVLSASQVTIDADATEHPSVHVDALRLRIALLPLLAGRVDPRELVLRGADLSIPQPVGAGMLRLRPPAWLAAFSARIENSRLSIGRIAFTGIDASLETLDTGALSASGTAQFSGQTWRFTARLTATGSDGAAGFNATLDGQGLANGLGANFSGQLALDGTLAGTISARGPNLAVLLPAPPVPFRADGRLAIGSGLATIDDLALQISGSPASGEVALRVAPTPRLDIDLTASRLDLDAWLPVLLGARATIAGLDVPIRLVVAADAAPLGGGTLEHVRAALDLSTAGLLVREVSAQVPGNGSVWLSGRMRRGDPANLRFDGHAQLNAPVLRATLSWLDEALPQILPPHLLTALPSGVARQASLSANVAVGSAEIALQGLTGSLDDVPITGTLGIRRGEPSAFTIDLSLDRLSLDPWLPLLPTDLTTLPRNIFPVDAELRLNVREAVVAGTTIDGLAVDAGIEAGNVILRRLEGSARGARFAASGMLGDGGRLNDGRLSVETKDAGLLADLLPSSLRATPALWHGPGKLEVQASGPQQSLATDVELALSDAELDASATVNLKSGEWSATSTLLHPGARRLIASLGLNDLPGLPDWIGDGSLSLMAHLAGGGGRLAAEKFDLTAATLHASGSLAIDLQGAEPRLSGNVNADAATLPMPSSDSDVPLPLRLLHGWRGDVRFAIGQLALGTEPALRDLSGTLSLKDDKLTSDNLVAKLGDGTVSGSIAFDGAASPPTLAAQATVSDAIINGALTDTPIDLVAGHADASAQVTASGYSPSVILATLSGRLVLTVKDGTVSGFDLFRLKQAVEKPDPKSSQTAADDALHSGATGFDQLNIVANVSHGDLTFGIGSMTGASGDAHLSGGINLANHELDVRIALQPALPSPPEVAIHLTGPANHPNRAPELDDLARWMAALTH